MPTSVEGRVELIDPSHGLAFRATNARGHSILLGSTPEDPAAAHSWTGVSPMEVVLLGLGGCTGIDVISTLRKMRQDVTAYAVRVRGHRRDDHPRIYTRIEVEHEVHGLARHPIAFPLSPLRIAGDHSLGLPLSPVWRLSTLPIPLPRTSSSSLPPSP